jgi:hypothetical protein
VASAESLLGGEAGKELAAGKETSVEDARLDAQPETENVALVGALEPWLGAKIPQPKDQPS